MPLSPKCEYSAQIYAEILSSVGASLIKLMGPKAALGVFSRVARPVGVRDARRLMRVLGAGKGNAASAAVVLATAARVLGVNATIDLLEPSVSKVRTNKCMFGDIVLHHKAPLLCALCAEYNAGIGAALDTDFTASEKKISGGYASCIGTFSVQAPANSALPSTVRMDIAIGLVRALYDVNGLVVSTFSSLLVGLGGRASRILGSAALVPARAAFGAGVYQGPVFSRVLELSCGLGDAALLVSGVRETLGCVVGAGFSGGGFSLVTKKCPQASHCSVGNFLEVACVSYSRGLLSRWGDFGIMSEIRDGVCRQDFVVRVAQPVVGAVSRARFVARGKAKRGSVFGRRAKRGLRKSAAAKRKKVR